MAKVRTKRTNNSFSLHFLITQSCMQQGNIGLWPLARLHSNNTDLIYYMLGTALYKSPSYTIPTMDTVYLAYSHSYHTLKLISIGLSTKNSNLLGVPSVR